MEFSVLQKSPDLNRLEYILSPQAKEEVPSTLESLQRRLPLERSSAGFTLQPVFIEYMTDRLVDEIFKEIETFDKTKKEKISLLKNHALLKAQAADYVRETQERLILKPLVDRFEDFELYIEDQLAEILANLPKPRQSHRKPRSPKPSYAAGNILNLLNYLGIDLTGYDFSNLVQRGKSSAPLKVDFMLPVPEEYYKSNDRV